MEDHAFSPPSPSRPAADIVPVVSLESITSPIFLPSALSYAPHLRSTSSSSNLSQLLHPERHPQLRVPATPSIVVDLENDAQPVDMGTPVNLDMPNSLNSTANIDLSTRIDVAFDVDAEHNDAALRNNPLLPQRAPSPTPSIIPQTSDLFPTSAPSRPVNNINNNNNVTREDDSEVICLDSPASRSREEPPPRKLRRLNDSSSVIVVDDEGGAVEASSRRPRPVNVPNVEEPPRASRRRSSATERGTQPSPSAPAPGATERVRRTRPSPVIVSDESSPITETPQPYTPSRTANHASSSSLPGSARGRHSRQSTSHSIHRAISNAAAFQNELVSYLASTSPRFSAAGPSSVRGGAGNGTRVTEGPLRSMPALRAGAIPGATRDRRTSRTFHSRRHSNMSNASRHAAHMSIDIVRQMLEFIDPRGANRSRRLGRVEVTYVHGGHPLDYESLVRLDEELLRERNAAPKEEISALPKVKATKQDTDIRCVVCMCDIEEGEDLRVLPCKHKYHASCIDGML